MERSSRPLLAVVPAVFFPQAYDDIDWSRGYEALDKELAQLVREAETGQRLADKLFKVWRKNGDEAWVLIHIEVQAQAEALEPFGERLYTYNYRIYDRFRRPVATLIVLGDAQPDWRPRQFGYTLWGTEVLLRFPSVKLLDFEGRESELERHANPFALIVLAHLQSLATRDDAQARRGWKVRLVKNLLDRGLVADDIRQLFRVIDWLLDLPRELAQSFWQEVQEFEKERTMPVFTSTEQYLIDKGREAGLELGERESLLASIADWLQHKFGTAGAALVPPVRRIKDVKKLRKLQHDLWSADSLAAARALLRGTKQRKK